MRPARVTRARMAAEHPDVRQHLFHGAHDSGKLAGVAEVRIHPETREAEPGDPVKLTAVVVNAKAGHKIPSGSAEERVLWLHVEARDAKGKVTPPARGPEGIRGRGVHDRRREGPCLPGYRRDKGLQGLPRDGRVPDGDRIFRLPYFDPKGRMTIAQWNTARLGTDYRLAPLRAVTETFSWTLPADAPPGPVTVTARIWYSRLVSSVAEFMKVPREEWLPEQVNEHTTTFIVVD